MEAEHSNLQSPGPDSADAPNTGNAPPDGGWDAWKTVFCSHLVILNTWGVVNSFGAFQTTYASMLAPVSPSAISWIGSLQVFLLFFIGTIAGWLSDIGLFRFVLATGSILQIVGVFAAASSTEYWQLLLAQGVCMGLGNGLIFCPSLAVLSTYFKKRKSLAIGIAMAGSSTGGLIIPSMVRQLLPQVGYPWTMRAIGFVQLGTLLIVNFLMRPRIPPSQKSKLIDPSAFRDLGYSLYAMSFFLNFLGVYFAFYYVASFARTQVNSPFSYDESLNLLLILNGVGLLGRVLPNYFADEVTGSINMLLPMSIISSLLCFCWIAVRSTAGLYTWTIFYAISAAGVQSMSPAGLSALTEDLSKAGVRMGMVFTIVSFAVLCGPPIEGLIISQQDGTYWGAQIFAGSSLMLGSILLAATRTVKLRAMGKTLWSRV
ncbi:hypothetical protein BP6252_05871 [Coleophoma cylindrospora]|uniref:Major facilitator superfamily (MFS) profile domain-containing protein n=1 Tax=Coleophoma cylindrospora TaxID=1849047 RepID=A0A3D8RV11_9HELO|nr:hypothetical protein BP6252_05871 [Coleophoma cylindrospora]